jgi:hypothetical protein
MGGGGHLGAILPIRFPSIAPGWLDLSPPSDMSETCHDTHVRSTEW